jgi:hypothetical protein
MGLGDIEELVGTDECEEGLSYGVGAHLSWAFLTDSIASAAVCWAS